MKYRKNKAYVKILTLKCVNYATIFCNYATIPGINGFTFAT